MEQQANGNPESTIDHNNRYRTKNHEAVLKLKETDKHIEMMKRRFKYLQVRDEEYRSKTIQSEHKLALHDLRRHSIKKERTQLQKSARLKQAEVEKTKEKNQQLKEQIEKKIQQVKQKILIEKQMDYQKAKTAHEVNEQIVHKIKEQDYEEKQMRRREVNKMEDLSRSNVSKFKEVKYQELVKKKSLDCQSVLEVASSREKELMELAKMEEQMIKKSSESMQASQVMRNKLRQVLGDERRFTRLPSIHNKTGNHSTRGSTGNTQIITI